jgi:predicted GNAT family acetyltransferase
MSEISIRHNTDRSRFEVLDGDSVVGKAAYLEYPADKTQRIFYHTVINEEYGGNGFAGELAAYALDETVDAGLTIVPVCPFIKKFLRKHPEYAENVTAVAPAHLEFVNTALSRRSRPGPTAAARLTPRQ